jgi:hypothetical protein
MGFECQTVKMSDLCAISYKFYNNCRKYILNCVYYLPYLRGASFKSLNINRFPQARLLLFITARR